MTLFDTYTREQLRQSYAQAWAKHLARVPLTPLEALITDVIGRHPEYQQLVADPEAVLGFEANTDGHAENPFLHMGLHLAVREQLSIDRPPGVRELLKDFQSPHGDAHAAEHVLMEALGETLWKAQRSGQAPDEKEYLALARARLARLRTKPAKR
jgi:Domain of unknown function (DUF1841)